MLDAELGERVAVELCARQDVAPAGIDVPELALLLVLGLVPGRERAAVAAARFACRAATIAPGPSRTSSSEHSNDRRARDG
jgi:hypothetical protein